MPAPPSNCYYNSYAVSPEIQRRHHSMRHTNNTIKVSYFLTQKHFTSLRPPSSPQAHLEEDKTFVLLDDEDDDENDNEGKDDFLEDDTETDVHDVTG